MSLNTIDEDAPVAPVAPDLSENAPIPSLLETVAEGVNISRTDDILQRIHDYVETVRPKLCILTPCYGSMCHVNYLQALMATLDLFRSFQFPVTVEFCKGDSMITRARNNLVAKAMADPAVTHLMFIDSDLIWNPMDILKMVVANRGVVGGVYPLKKYHWDRMMPRDRDASGAVTAAGPGPIPEWLSKRATTELRHVVDEHGMIQSRLLNYNVNYWSHQLQIDNNLAEVRHVPTGFMLMQRSTIETLFKHHPETKYQDDVGFLNAAEQAFAYALFDGGVRDGHYFSEDWLFCDRWNQTGHKVWIDVSVTLTHSGMEDYRGSYLASLM